MILWLNAYWKVVAIYAEFLCFSKELFLHSYRLCLIWSLNTHELRFNHPHSLIVFLPIYSSSYILSVIKILILSQLICKYLVDASNIKKHLTRANNNPPLLLTRFFSFHLIKVNCYVTLNPVLIKYIYKISFCSQEKMFLSECEN